MDNFLKYLFQDLGRVLRAFIDIFVAFFNFLNYLLNFPMRMEIIKSYADDFTTLDWILMLAVNIALAVALLFMVVLLVKLMKRLLRFRIPANYEKDKLLNMRIAELGGDPEAAYKALMEEQGQADEDLPENLQVAEDTGFVLGNRNSFNSPCVDPSESRFFRLTSVDNVYKTE